MESQFSDQRLHLNHWDGNIETKAQTARDLLTPGVINYWVLCHLSTKTGVESCSKVYVTGQFTQTTNKTKAQKQSSTDRIPTSHSAAYQRLKKKKKFHCSVGTSPLTRSQQKLLNQYFPLRSKAKRESNATLKSEKRRLQME